MKKEWNCLFLLLMVVLFGCKKDVKDEDTIDNSPLYQQMGFGKKFSSLNITPLYDTDNASSEFMSKWNLAKEKLLKNYGGRQLQSFEIKFTTATQLTVRVSYKSDSGLAVAIYTYNYTLDEQGVMTLKLASVNGNATNLLPYISDLISDYIERYQFKLDWIDDKLPGSKGTTAAYYRSDDPSSYFYGTIK